MFRMIAALLLAAWPAAAQMEGPLTIARQGSYFVGGRDLRSDSLSNLPAYAVSGTISVDQVYVRFQEPVAPARCRCCWCMAAA